MPKLCSLLSLTVSANSQEVVVVPADQFFRICHVSLTQFTPMNTRISVFGKLEQEGCMSQSFVICNLFGMSCENHSLQLDIPSNSKIYLSTEGKYSGKLQTS
jgi:hypothetical protein